MEGPCLGGAVPWFVRTAAPLLVSYCLTRPNRSLHAPYMCSFTPNLVLCNGALCECKYATAQAVLCGRRNRAVFALGADDEVGYAIAWKVCGHNHSILFFGVVDAALLLLTDQTRLCISDLCERERLAHGMHAGRLPC